MPHTNNNFSSIERAIKSHTRLSMLLTILFILQSVTFIIYAYWKYSSKYAPQQFAGDMRKELIENLPEIRQDIIDQTRVHAPKIAGELSLLAQQSLPRARVKLEAILREQMADGLDKFTATSAAHFREYLDKNEEEVRKVLLQIHEFPDQTDEALLNFENELNEYADTDLREVARSGVEVFSTVNDRIERINASRDLNPRELLEQRILRILRALQLRVTEHQ